MTSSTSATRSGSGSTWHHAHVSPTRVWLQNDADLQAATLRCPGAMDPATEEINVEDALDPETLAACRASLGHPLHLGEGRSDIHFTSAKVGRASTSPRRRSVGHPQHMVSSGGFLAPSWRVTLSSGEIVSVWESRPLDFVTTQRTVVEPGWVHLITASMLA